MPKLKLDLSLLPPRFAKARELVKQALGEPSAIDWRAEARSYLELGREARLEALTLNPWAGEPALGYAFVHEGRALLKSSPADARSFARLARQVAGTVLAPGKEPLETAIAELAFDLAACAATLAAESRLVEADADGADAWMLEAEHSLEKGTGWPQPKASYLHVKGMLLWLRGRPLRALVQLRKAAGLSATVGDHATEALAYLRQSLISASMGNEPASAQAFQRMLALVPKMSEEDAQELGQLVDLLRKKAPAS